MRTSRSLLATAGLLAVLATGCTDDAPPEGAWTETDSASVRVVTLRPDLLPDTLEAEPLPGWESQPPFGDLVDVADAGDGRIVALDAGAAVAWVFQADGWVLERFGDAGVGPGEFYPGGLSSLVVRSDTAYIPDLRAARLVVYTLDGTFADAVPLDDQPAVPTGWTAGPSGDLLARSADDSARIVRIARDGSAADTLLALPLPEAGVPNRPGPTAGPLASATPLAPRHVWCPLPDGRIAWASTHSHEVRISDPAAGGAPGTVLRGPGQPTPLSDADEAHVRDLLRRSLRPRPGTTLPDSVLAAIDAIPLPGGAPILGGLLCGPDGRLWIQPAAPVSTFRTDALRADGTAGWGGPVWHVVDLTSNTFEVVRLPGGARVTRVLDDLLLGIQVDGSNRETVGRWSYAR